MPVRAAVLCLVAACVRDPGVGVPPECNTSADCDPGLECRRNACYGNPPALDFAAAIIPPADRNDLGTAEIETVTFAANGETQLDFSVPVEVTGRVLLHEGDSQSVAARVTFQRPSRIPGAAVYSVQAAAKEGKASGETAFSAILAPNLDGELYDVTIIPDDRSLAPMRKMQLAVTANQSMDLALVEAEGLKMLVGTVTDAGGRPLPGLQVSAYGHRADGAPLELASSLVTTDEEGRFALALPIAWEDAFDIVCAPLSGDDHAPALRRRSLFIEDGSPAPEIELSYPAYPTPASYDLPVFGPSDAGGQEPSAGAKITLRTTIASYDGDEVEYTVEATADSDGMARVWLVPGAAEDRIYSLDVVPPPGVPHAAAWDRTMVVGPNPTSEDGRILAEVELLHRAYVTGQVKDAEGVPVENVLIRPQLSPFFLFAATPESKTRAGSIELPQDVTTDRNGGFALYLDPRVGDAITSYDLDLIPPSGSRDPRWSRDRVTPGESAQAVNLGEIILPGSSLGSSVVKDAAGNPVGDAEVRIYVRSNDDSVCAGASLCVPPARLRAVAKSGSDGYVVLVLPSP